MKPKPILFFLLVFSVSLANSQTDTQIIRGFTLQTENDVFTGLLGFKNEDKDYSGGFKFEFYTDYLNKGIFPLFRNRYEDDDNTIKYNYNSFYIHGLGFTPNRENFATTTIDSSQRPYASILGIGWKRIAVFSDMKSKNSCFFKNSAIVSDVFIGKVGTKSPGNVQNFLHEYLTNSIIVQGWDNQIANGGKWVLDYRVKFIKMVYQFDTTGQTCFLTPKIFITPQGSFGNLFFNTGIKLSLSDQDPEGLGLTSSISSNEFSESDLLPNYKSNFLKHFGYEVYFKFQYIYHNTLLMGMPIYDSSIYVIPKEFISPYVLDIGLRVLYNYYPDKPTDKTKARYNTAFLEIIYRSKEFVYGPNHIFASIGVTIINITKKE